MNRPVERPRPVDSRVAARSEIVLRLIVQNECDLAVRKTLLHLFQAQLDNACDILLRKCALKVCLASVLLIQDSSTHEYDDFVYPVDEFWWEVALNGTHYKLPRLRSYGPFTHVI